jgi:uncharacterized protein
MCLETPAPKSVENGNKDYGKASFTRICDKSNRFVRNADYHPADTDVLYNRATMKLLTKFGIASLLVLFLTVVVHAEPVAQLRPTGYVNDFAHVLDQNTFAQMEGICLQIDQKAHAQIAVVTINSLDGADVESYAVDLFKNWGIGNKSSNRGVLILYAIKDHRARLEVGYGLEPILPDGKVGGFQREAIPLMQSGNYSAALLLVTNRVAGVIAQDAGIQIPNVPAPAPIRAPPQGGQHISLGGIIVFVVILLIILCTPLRGVLFWILLSQMSGGRSGGNWGGGGFGGGGGGFGGFGGGSSGGGGASSSW